ncbi:LPXTG cell wall anchor domain-containing protein [Hazenella sp. IB182353]|uniref:LPXTG cell wall anchor domain-containing protein n=1 Tax=Polycladospora coralii TaxID=2771432 RepID=UPI001BCD6E76|nr:LPXTG cell wall anchor domain-containing protein [Polycladospora coralii]MBS7529770.1 LPXTG cell wall anchor domain-containing protein [Polycladospora coralii]
MNTSKGRNRNQTSLIRTRGSSYRDLLRQFDLEENDPNRRNRRKKQFIRPARLSNAAATVSLCLATGMSIGIGTAFADKEVVPSEKPLDEAPAKIKVEEQQVESVEREVERSISETKPSEGSDKKIKEEPTTQQVKEKPVEQTQSKPIEEIPKQENTAKPEASSTETGNTAKPEASSTETGNTAKPETSSTETGNTAKPEASSTETGNTAKPETSSTETGNTAKPETSSTETGNTAKPETSSTETGNTAKPETSSTGTGNTAQTGQSDKNDGASATNPSTPTESSTADEPNSDHDIQTVDGGELPDTAGNDMNGVLIGGVSALIGGAYFLRQRKVEKN